MVETISYNLTQEEIGLLNALYPVWFKNVFYINGDLSKGEISFVNKGFVERNFKNALERVRTTEEV